jgi:rod shape-determining protein MreC
MKTLSPRPLRTDAIVLVVIGVLALALGGFLNPLARLAFAPFIEAQTWLGSRFKALQIFLTSPAEIAQLRQQNLIYEAEIARLQTEMIRLQQQVSDTEVLLALLDFARANPQHEYLGARVIGRDPSPFLHYIIINSGSDDGLHRGMPVVNQEGLVGRISAVTAGAARVQLITDPNSIVNVKIQPSNADARLLGSLTGDISLDLIPQQAAVQTGNLVLTSGLGGNFPANILIGQITGVRQEPTALFQLASIQPVVDFFRLELVLVIINFQPVDITPLAVP